MYEWGPTAFLPVFELLGTDFEKVDIVTCRNCDGTDLFSKVDFRYSHAMASIKVGDGVKSEGELIISGTKGYVYVPAPWWKTDYFELRFENMEENKRYFYQLDGEGIRYELVAFARAVERGKLVPNISYETTKAISEMMNRYHSEKACVVI